MEDFYGHVFVEVLWCELIMNCVFLGGFENSMELFLSAFWGTVSVEVSGMLNNQSELDILLRLTVFLILLMILCCCLIP